MRFIRFGAKFKVGEVLSCLMLLTARTVCHWATCSSNSNSDKQAANSSVMDGKSGRQAGNGVPEIKVQAKAVTLRTFNSLGPNMVSRNWSRYCGDHYDH